MKHKMINKAKNKKGATHTIEMLIAVVIIAAVASFCCVKLGEKAKAASDKTTTTVQSSVDQAGKFATTGLFTD